ncbi:MAG: thiamine pyrophosphate-dependent enzyme [Rhodothermaceae bacterium]
MNCTVAKALSYGLDDLGTKVVTHVPGCGATDTFFEYKQLINQNIFTSFNEEAAYTIAHGASIAGARSACVIKTHGFLKAANSINDSLYTSLTAGFVTILFDDKTGKSSDNILEIEPILKGFSAPYKVADPEKIYDEIITAFEESEKLQLPYFLVVDSAFSQTEINIERREIEIPEFNFSRDIKKHIVHPLLSDYQYKIFKTKTSDQKFENIEDPSYPVIPDDIPERIKESALVYKGFFDCFKDIRGTIVTGDTTLSSYYSFPPYNCVDILTYIGGSIPLAIGASLAGHKNVWALSGDFGFNAAGHMALIEVIERKVPLKIVLFNNKKAASTGGQPVNTEIIDRLLEGYKEYVVKIASPENVDGMKNILQVVGMMNQLKIIMIEY